MSTNESVTASPSALAGLSVATLNSYLGELTRLAKDGGAVADQLALDAAFLKLLSDSGLGGPTAMTAAQRRAALSKALGLVFAPTEGNSLRGVLPGQFAALVSLYGGASNLLASAPELVRASDPLLLTDGVFAGLVALELNRVVKVVGPRLYVSLSEAQVRALSSDQLGAISAGADAAKSAGAQASAWLPAAFLNKLNSVGVAKLLWNGLLEWVLADDTVRSGVAAATLGRVPAVTWALLTDAAIQRLSSEQFQGLAISVINASSDGKPSLWQRMNQSQQTIYSFGKLTAAEQPSAWLALNGAQRLQILRDSYLAPRMPATVLAVLTPTDAAQLSAQDWARLSDGAVAGLSNAALAALSLDALATPAGAAQTFLLQRLTMPQQLACTIPLNLPDAPALNRYAAALLEMAQTGSLQSSASLPQEPAFIWLKAYGAVADLSTLNSTQRRDWLSKVLGQLFNPANANHLSDLTAAQFTALTGPYGGAAALLSAVPSLLQEAQALRLNSAVFSTLPAGALNGLAKLVGPSLYLGLSEAELRALNTDQLMAISAGADAARVAGKAAAQFLPAAFLNKLNATAVSRILWSHLLEWVLQDDGVRTGLSKTTVGSVPVMTWSLLSDGALQRLSSEQLNGVSAGVANASSNGKPTLLQRLSPAQRTLYTVGKLSAAAQPGGFAALSPADRLVVLQDDFTVTLLGGATLATFSAVEWGAVSDAALQGMTSTQLGTIPFTVAQNRTDSTARSLLQRMTPAQQDIYGFGQLSAADQTTKFADRSTAQKLLLVHDAYIGPRLSGATLARLSALEWAQVSDAAIQRMATAQLLGIPTPVASASPSAGAPTLLQRMSAAQQSLYQFGKASVAEQQSSFAAMSSAQRLLILNDAAVGPLLSAVSVRLLSAREWAAASDVAVRRLTPRQLDAITSEVLGAVDATGYASVEAAKAAGKVSLLARLGSDQTGTLALMQQGTSQQAAILLALSPARRLALLGDAYVEQKLAPDTLAVVTPAEWAQLSDAAVQRLQPAQLAKLTLATLTALSEGNRAPLLQRLSFAQLAGIDWSAALPTAQTLNDYVAELARVATAGGAVSTLMLAQPAFVRLWVEAGVAKPGELDATQRRAWLGQALGLLFDAAHGPHGPHSATALTATTLQGLLDAYDASAAALFAAVPTLLKGAEPLTLLSPTYTGLPEAYRKSLLVDLGAALLQPLSKAQVQALTSTTIAEIAAAADSARSLGRTSATVLPASFINLLTSQQFLSLFPSAGGRAGEPVRLEWILMDPANGPLVDGTWLALWGENYWRKASPGLVQRLTTRQLAAFSESTVFTLAPGGDRSLWTKLLDSQAKRFKETKLSLEQLNDLFANPTHDKSGMMRDEYIAERLSAPALALATAEDWAQVPNGVLSGYRIEQLVDIPKAVAQAVPNASLGSLLQRLAPRTQQLYLHAQLGAQAQATAFAGYDPALRQAILQSDLLVSRTGGPTLALLTEKDWDQISDAALRGLSAEQLSGITPATASSLGSRLSVNQWVDYNFLQCSEAQQSSYFAGLPAAQRLRLVQDAYVASRLNAASIAQLSASDWASVSDAAIHALRTAQLLLIDLENVFANQGSPTVPALQQRLTDAQMVGFGLGRLSAEEQNELFPGMPETHQALALQDPLLLARMSPAALATVGVQTWARVSTPAVQSLTIAQLQAIPWSVLTAPSGSEAGAPAPLLARLSRTQQAGTPQLLHLDAAQLNKWVGELITIARNGRADAGDTLFDQQQGQLWQGLMSEWGATRVSDLKDPQERLRWLDRSLASLFAQGAANSISALTASSFQGLTSLYGWPERLFSAIPNLLPGKDVSLLSSPMFSTMGQAYFRSFVAHVAGTGIFNMNDSVAQQLTSEQLAVLSDQVSEWQRQGKPAREALPASFVNRLAPSAMHVVGRHLQYLLLGQQEGNVLSAQVISRMPVRELSALNLSEAAVRQLLPSQLAALSAEQLFTGQSPLIKRIAAEQYASLQPAVWSGITSADYAGLSQAQRSAAQSHFANVLPAAVIQSATKGWINPPKPQFFNLNGEQLNQWVEEMIKVAKDGRPNTHNTGFDYQQADTLWHSFLSEGGRTIISDLKDPADRLRWLERSLTLLFAEGSANYISVLSATNFKGLTALYGGFAERLLRAVPNLLPGGDVSLLSSQMFSTMTPGQFQSFIQKYADTAIYKMDAPAAFHLDADQIARIFSVVRDWRAQGLPAREALPASFVNRLAPVAMRVVGKYLDYLLLDQRDGNALSAQVINQMLPSELSHLNLSDAAVSELLPSQLAALKAEQLFAGHEGHFITRIASDKYEFLDTSVWRDITPADYSSLSLAQQRAALFNAAEVMPAAVIQAVPVADLLDLLTNPWREQALPNLMKQLSTAQLASLDSSTLWQLMEGDLDGLMSNPNFKSGGIDMATAFLGVPRPIYEALANKHRGLNDGSVVVTNLLVEGSGGSGGAYTPIGGGGQTQPPTLGGSGGSGFFREVLAIGGQMPLWESVGTLSPAQIGALMGNLSAAALVALSPEQLANMPRLLRVNLTAEQLFGATFTPTQLAAIRNSNYPPLLLYGSSEFTATALAPDYWALVQAETVAQLDWERQAALLEMHPEFAISDGGISQAFTDSPRIRLARQVLFDTNGNFRSTKLAVPLEEVGFALRQYLIELAKTTEVKFTENQKKIIKGWELAGYILPNSVAAAARNIYYLNTHARLQAGFVSSFFDTYYIADAVKNKPLSVNAFRPNYPIYYKIIERSRDFSQMYRIAGSLVSLSAVSQAFYKAANIDVKGSFEYKADIVRGITFLAFALQIPWNYAAGAYLRFKKSPEKGLGYAFGEQFQSGKLLNEYMLGLKDTELGRSSPFFNTPEKLSAIQQEIAQMRRDSAYFSEGAEGFEGPVNPFAHDVYNNGKIRLEARRVNGVRGVLKQTRFFAAGPTGRPGITFEKFVANQGAWNVAQFMGFINACFGIAATQRMSPSSGMTQAQIDALKAMAAINLVGRSVLWLGTQSEALWVSQLDDVTALNRVLTRTESEGSMLTGGLVGMSEAAQVEALLVPAARLGSILMGAGATLLVLSQLGTGITYASARLQSANNITRPGAQAEMAFTVVNAAVMLASIWIGALRATARVNPILTAIAMLLPDPASIGQAINLKNFEAEARRQGRTVMADVVYPELHKIAALNSTGVINWFTVVYTPDLMDKLYARMAANDFELLYRALGEDLNYFFVGKDAQGKDAQGVESITAIRDGLVKQNQGALPAGGGMGTPPAVYTAKSWVIQPLAAKRRDYFVTGDALDESMVSYFGVVEVDADGSEARVSALRAKMEPTQMLTVSNIGKAVAPSTATPDQRVLGYVQEVVTVTAPSDGFKGQTVIDTSSSKNLLTFVLGTDAVKLLAGPGLTSAVVDQDDWSADQLAKSQLAIQGFLDNGTRATSLHFTGAQSFVANLDGVSNTGVYIDAALDGATLSSSAANNAYVNLAGGRSNFTLTGGHSHVVIRAEESAVTFEKDDNQLSLLVDGATTKAGGVFDGGATAKNNVLDFALTVSALDITVDKGGMSTYQGYTILNGKKVDAQAGSFRGFRTLYGGQGGGKITLAAASELDMLWLGQGFNSVEVMAGNEVGITNGGRADHIVVTDSTLYFDQSKTVTGDTTAPTVLNLKGASKLEASLDVGSSLIVGEGRFDPVSQLDQFVVRSSGGTHDLQLTGGAAHITMHEVSAGNVTMYKEAAGDRQTGEDVAVDFSSARSDTLVGWGSNGFELRGDLSKPMRNVFAYYWDDYVDPDYTRAAPGQATAGVKVSAGKAVGDDLDQTLVNFLGDEEMARGGVKVKEYFTVGLLMKAWDQVNLDNGSAMISTGVDAGFINVGSDAFKQALIQLTPTPVVPG